MAIHSVVASDAGVFVEKAFIGTELQYRAIVEHSSDLITTLTEDGTVLYMSPSVQPLLGYWPSELIGQSVFAFIHPDDLAEARAAMQRALTSVTRPILVAFRLRHNDGTWPHFESIGQASESSAGTRTIVVSSRDVTDRKNFEREQARLFSELRVAQETAERATRAKSEFLTSMSHEIRTPMNAVLGLTELLLDTELTPEQRRHLQMVRDSGETLLLLLNDILDLSKIESDRLELEIIPFDLVSLVRATTNLFSSTAQTAGLQLVAQVSPDVPQFVRGDPTRLRQILTNLIGNAVKFTPAGRVVVSAMRSGADAGTVAVRFAVQDTGIGIPTDKLETIFREFTQVDASTTRQYGGSGLGLPIARRLVRHMGGDLSVTSELNRGSEISFSLRLPVASGAALPAAQPSDTTGQFATIASVRRLHILLAEDNVVNQEVAAAMLRRRGHLVDIADNGAKAVAAVTAAPPGTIDVILMDIHMPQMDGFAATAAIRLLPGYETLPIIALTADALVGEREKCLRGGMSGYLSKPFKGHDLFAVVERRDAPADAAVIGDDSPHEQPAPVDIAEFRASMAKAGAEDAVDGILETFELDAPKRIAALMAAIDSGVASDSQDAAHAYKSAAGSIGARSLAARLLAIERAAADGKVDEIRALVAGVQKEHDAVITYLRAQRVGALQHA